MRSDPRPLTLEQERVRLRRSGPRRFGGSKAKPSCLRCERGVNAPLLGAGGGRWRGRRRKREPAGHRPGPCPDPPSFRIREGRFYFSQNESSWLPPPPPPPPALAAGLSGVCIVRASAWGRLSVDLANGQEVGRGVIEYHSVCTRHALAGLRLRGNRIAFRALADPEGFVPMHCDSGVCNEGVACKGN